LSIPEEIFLPKFSDGEDLEAKRDATFFDEIFQKSLFNSPSCSENKK